MIGLLKSFGNAIGLAPSAPEFDVSPTLPLLQARTAAALVAKAGLTVLPGEPDPAALTASQFLGYKLNVSQDMLGATQAIAHGLPESKGLQWATDSAKLVEHKLSPSQKNALAAAQAFQASPSLITRNGAAAAAEKAGPNGPGGLAAKAASLGSVPGAAPIPGAEKLLPVCVAGAVVTAVALSPSSAPKLSETPTAPKLDIPLAAVPRQPLPPQALPPGSAAAAKNVAAFKPFIDRGLALAAG